MSQLSSIYFGTNATFKAGDPSSDEHIPIGPMVSLSGQLVFTDTEKVYTLESLDPTLFVEKELKEATMTFRSYYRGPLMMSKFFTYKGLPTAWSGTGDVMSFNFSSIANRDVNIWCQMHIEDQSAGTDHLDLLFDGGEMIAYRWIVEADGALMEEFEIIFCECTENVQAVDIDDGLDDGSFDRAGYDGGWDLWDGAKTAGQVYLAKECVITAGATIAGIYPKTTTLEIIFPRTSIVQSSALAPVARGLGIREYNCTIEGVMHGNNDVNEALKILASKTAVTFKIQYGTTKFLQVTNMVLMDIPGIGLAEAGKELNVSYIFQPGAKPVASFSWTANEATDPSDYITHTNV